jgi:uncharacterized protein YeaO (DUF488 family)
MAIRVVRLGSPRVRGEGVRLGTVRHPPRGVAKADFGRRDYFDVWLPELAPAAETVSWALSTPWTPARWRHFARRYRATMRRPAARHLLSALAALSRQTNFSIGCYCPDARYCHRTLLAELLTEAGADMAPRRPTARSTGPGTSARPRTAAASHEGIASDSRDAATRPGPTPLAKR